MAKTTKPAVRRKTPTKRKPATAKVSPPATLEVAESQKKQRIAALQPAWVPAEEVREQHAKSDAERFNELCSIPLPSKINSTVTAMQRSFAYEVFRDGNQQAAYRRAGYKGKNVPILAHAVMQSLGVAQAIEWLADACTAQDEHSTEWIVRMLNRVRVSCMEPFQVLDRNGKATGTMRIDAAGALRALELIGKARGIFTQTIKHEHSGSVTHLLQAIAGTGKPALEDRQAIDVTPASEQVDTGDAAQQSDDENV